MKHKFWRFTATFSLIFAVILTAVLATPSPAKAGGGPDAICEITPNFYVYISFLDSDSVYYVVENDSIAGDGQPIAIESLQGPSINGPTSVAINSSTLPAGATVYSFPIAPPDVVTFGAEWASAAPSTLYASYYTADYASSQTTRYIWVGYNEDDVNGTWTYYACDVGAVWPTPTPTPTASPTVSPSASPTSTPSISPSVTPSATPTVTPTPTATPSVSPSASPTPSDNPTPSPSDSPSATPTPSPSETPGPSPTSTPSPTVTPSPSATPVASGVVVNPTSITMGLNCAPVTMTANLLDQNGQPITSGITSIDWGMSSTNSVGTLENITGNQANFKPLNNGTGNVTVTIWYQGQSYTGSIAVTVTDSANCNSNNNNNNSNNSNNNSSGSAPQCTDSKPGNAPTLTGASVTGDNEVTLYWSKANDPVTYYLITYGNKPGEQAYGNPNVGDKNTTQYTVKNLSSGQTYYFKVRAGNSCAPGDYSNELSATPGGRVLTEPAAGFQAGVLGENVEAATPSPSGEISPEATSTATPAAEVLGTTTTCSDPVWKIWLLVGDILMIGLALVLGTHDGKKWWMIILPATVISLGAVWIYFCAKLMWMFIYTGIFLMAYVLKKMSEVEV